MKKVYPYVFPVVALLFVAFLAYRWYSLRTAPTETSLGEGVQIENLSQTEAERVLRGTGDFKTVDLKGNPDFSGKLRYEVRDGRVYFSVMADLADLESGSYQVWVKNVGSEMANLAFPLEVGKAGYVGSAAVSVEDMPFEVMVTRQNVGQVEMGEVVLSGVVAQD